MTVTVRVKVTLNGQQSLSAVTAMAESLGSKVLAGTDRYRSGVFTAYVPISAVATLAVSPGVRSMVLAAPAQTNVGATTSQGAVALKTDQVNALGIIGAGITFGVMSDSYNTSTNPIKEPNDVASGDLPGTGNPLGHTQPVVVVVVVVDQPSGTDEGRAMAQIVHDLAADAKLCFATAYNTEVDFANHILALADKAGACKADVVVDDIIYLGEPFFSDGIIAQAVDQVVAAGIPCFASAGNRSGAQGYFADLNPVTKSTALTAGPTVDLSLIADSASASGFRLAEPEVRLKPDIAAIDGVNTAFFSSDSAEDTDTFPNFFGTSAAAPHAAGVAALLL